MRLEKTEVVVRYQVRFDPKEVAVLKRHARWQHRIGLRRHPDRGGDATLTKTELSQVADALGINAREWLTRQRLG
jgi:hypothetical protein